jgi:transcription initiation factor TFIIIB Brf1 subunit/transcription initiation factor TFIIB
MSEFDIFDTLSSKTNVPDFPLAKEGGCLHLNISTDYGMIECQDCGIEIKPQEVKVPSPIDNRSVLDNNRCWAPKKKSRGIRDDLKGLGIPDPVINIADDIFKIVTEGGIYRDEKRKSIIVACLLEAYKISGIPMSLQTLQEKIPINNITTGMKIVETKIKKYDVDRKRITHTSPVDSIRDILAKWENNTEVSGDIIQIYSTIEDQSSLINRSRAKSVAAGVIWYYVIKTHRNNIKLKDFSKKVELSESTITKIAKEISAILVTPHILAY